MSRQSRCAHCRRRFVPDPRVKTRRFCSEKPCQQARKAQWQRNKMAPIPIIKPTNETRGRPGNTSIATPGAIIAKGEPITANAIDCCKATATKPVALKPLAKMDASVPVFFVNPGTYHLIPATGEHLAKMDALSMKCHLIPIP